MYDLMVAGAALVFTGLALLVWGGEGKALATGIGGTLATFHWAGTRWLGIRLLAGRLASSRRRKVLLGALFLLKGAVLFGALWILIRLAGLSPAGLAFGYSALVVGLFGAALVSASRLDKRNSNA